MAGAGWQAFCDRLRAVGERISADDFPSDPRDRAEGYRHLGRLTVYALQRFLDFDDPEFPAFLRYDDDTIKWGGPNADNHYLRAKVDPAASYRLHLDATGLRELIISTPEGDMQLDQYRVFQERSLSQLEVDARGRIEVTLSPEPHAGNWIPLHSQVDHVLVRLYVADWTRDAAPEVYIEKLGNRGRAPARLEPWVLADRLNTAANWIERTVLYWNRFLAERRKRGEDNALSSPQSVPGGATDILYGAGWWRLGEGEGLLVECERPQARYWSFQLYSAPWFESLDIANRVCSLNGEQMQVDADEKFRLVVSAEDPGIPNWLDTEGRVTGLVSYRWVWSATAPVPSSRVILLSELRSLLPSTPTFDASAREAQVAERRAAITRRFRR